MTSTGAQRAFIGSFTTSGGRGIVQAAVDPATGALTPTAAVATVPNPSYLAVGRSGGGPVLYCVSETAQGAVAAYDVAGASPVPVGEPAPVGGADPTHLAVLGDHLVTANYSSGSVTALPLAADGSPGSPSGVLRNAGSGPDAERQEGPHAHQVVVPDPSGRWVLNVDLGTDSVRVCELDPATGGLRLHADVALPPGTGPRHLVVHPRGTHVYVLGELRPVVTVCRWDSAGGELRPVGEFPLGPDGAEDHAQPSAPVISLDGRRLWAAVRGTDTIVVLAVAEDGERLEVLTSVPCGGSWPRDLVLHPSGERLYAANERSGDVTWFDLDEEGVPRRAGALDVPAASSVLFV
ncbi:lactonase family protein [Streptomyces abyssomicinicus]|uniref:lactonase family protein n=1 Tax=Streptomyces abyssomicinicus TaxID=574929 RepID=UPI0012500AB1|nr:lactonase family protein [Streptomyces abyssomicinicus]